MHDTYQAIVDPTDAFARQHLNEEYAQMIRLDTATLCRKRPSPLVTGKPNTWACGIIHALGTVNFLFDNSQNPHVVSANLAKAFNIAASTSQAKSKLVRDILHMSPFAPEWTLPPRMEKNPRAWPIMANGMIVDARSMSRDVQEMAYQMRMIPYLPEET
jgi:hypothetical protein